MGAVEPRRGCERAGTADIFIACPDAFAASLKLDSSHMCSLWRSTFVLAGIPQKPATPQADFSCTWSFDSTRYPRT